MSCSHIKRKDKGTGSINLGSQCLKNDLQIRIGLGTV